jgi:hypothetical protein
MLGTKAMLMFSCRGQQTVGEILARYLGLQAMATQSSSYGDADQRMLTAIFDIIARRGTFPDLRKSVAGDRNYMLPDDPRLLEETDDDDDAIKDLSPVGADRFYDPTRAPARKGAVDFAPRADARDPETISGNRLDFALSYANTGFFYFSEENRASPLVVAETDSFVSGKWFKSNTDEPVRIETVTKKGKRYYVVAVNSRYSGQSAEAIGAMVLMELHKHLCLADHGTFTQADKLRGLMVIANFVNSMVEFSDDVDRLLQGFQKKYGFQNLSYELIYAAAQKDGDEGTGTRAALDYLLRQRVLPEAEARLRAS